ncbi:MAG: hypothetical protein Hyperionvirus10_57 [Hyperionvirus sp.]|uniref:Uncharacterized protein n=1 Tax=Hyperionvirus sp. TaxID=2487770 RepID=A0A3G5ABN1_9VIRU|nr:MAG: hypothetical protein Hyperionvirus10_57 [Hyperionvirus sp.]
MSYILKGGDIGDSISTIAIGIFCLMFLVGLVLLIIYWTQSDQNKNSNLQGWGYGLGISGLVLLVISGFIYAAMKSGEKTLR